METSKNISSEGFENRDAARADARDFTAIGGKITEGGERADGTWGWSGEIHVCDVSKSINGDFFCGRCGGTGRFVTGMLNGKLTGPGGICFRCNGKGFHNQADRARNEYRDMHQRIN